MGLAGTVYAAAKLAFIGGSLDLTSGGHTPFEPIALGCAVISGKHVRNFTLAYESLQSQGAARMVSDTQELASSVAELLMHPAALKAMQLAARKAFAAQGKATEQTLLALKVALPDVFTSTPPATQLGDISLTQLTDLPPGNALTLIQSLPNPE